MLNLIDYSHPERSLSCGPYKPSPKPFGPISARLDILVCPRRQDILFSPVDATDSEPHTVPLNESERPVFRSCISNRTSIEEGSKWREENMK